MYNGSILEPLECAVPVNLSIKNVPDPLVQRLRERAKRHHRSVQGELLAILEESVGLQRLTLEEVYSQVKALGFKTGSEAVTMVREDRDAR
ncbi:MAG: Arc family DNA-binding protein [Chloroflexi bacterium]|nr:Arc family DNA-binding protein [Chloroflexota bacterium]